ncbi:MAG: acetylserotonin O-methyltransferase [Nitrospirales bacterium]|nr:methyltransferase domain-containing protein [Nitrospira sp.]MDR4502775.1 acetylserotonin O-methyltransferase [Nitrospirales bacterium]
MSIHKFGDFREAVFQFRLPRILLTALELELFTVMNGQKWTIRALAKTLRVSQRGLDILCRNLLSAGLLRKDGARYQNSPFARRLLNRHSEDYRGAYLDLIQRQWSDWASLTQAVKTGKPIEPQGPGTPEYRRSFSWAMHERSLDVARQVAGQLNLKTATSLLDVGGGPGTYALEFLDKNPSLRATIFDRPEALDVAREIAQTRRSHARVSYMAGDFLMDPIQRKYDVMWLSNVIHIYSAAENLKLFRRLRPHLNPGGRLLIQDTFLVDRAGSRPAESNLFAVTMLLFTESGNTYQATDVQAWLKKAGYRKQGMVKLKKGTGDWEGRLIQGSL